MQDTILPFVVLAPDEPVRIDVATLEQRTWWDVASLLLASLVVALIVFWLG